MLVCVRIVQSDINSTVFAITLQAFETDNIQRYPENVFICVQFIFIFV